MGNNFSAIKEFYSNTTSRKKLNSEYCIVFVYNSPDTINDPIYYSECVYNEELNMILNSFRSVAEYVYHFDGEIAFAEKINNLKNKHNYILVYSMAQNVIGVGRRSFIPLLCDYYGLINIGANTKSTFLARSKDIMFRLVKGIDGVVIPNTYFVNSPEDLLSIPPRIINDVFLLKPTDESASIGLEVIGNTNLSKEKILNHLQDYMSRFPSFCIQEFIEGREVAVPLLRFENNYYCPGISEVDFPEGMSYLDYDAVAIGSYGYIEYDGKLSDQLINSSIKVAKLFGFKSISRVDFRIRGEICYIEDINVNPTVSEYNGVNPLFCNQLNSNPDCVYKLMVFAALNEYGLLEPSLNYSP